MKPADCKIPPSGKVNDFVQDPLKLRLRTHAQDTIVIVVPRTVEPRLRIQAQDTMMTCCCCCCCCKCHSRSGKIVNDPVQEGKTTRAKIRLITTYLGYRPKCKMTILLFILSQTMSKDQMNNHQKGSIHVNNMG